MDDHHFGYIFQWMISTLATSSNGWFPLWLHLPIDDFHFCYIFQWMISTFATSSNGWFPLLLHLPMDGHMMKFPQKTKKEKEEEEEREAWEMLEKLLIFWAFLIVQYEQPGISRSSSCCSSEISGRICETSINWRSEVAIRESQRGVPQIGRSIGIRICDNAVSQRNGAGDPSQVHRHVLGSRQFPILLGDCGILGCLHFCRTHFQWL